MCRAERERRANRVARRVGIGGAAVLAAYLIWRTPNELLPRIFAAASVLLVYVIFRRLVSRVMFEFMPRDANAAKRAAQEHGGGDPGAQA